MQYWILPCKIDVYQVPGVRYRHPSSAWQLRRAETAQQIWITPEEIAIVTWHWSQFFSLLSRVHSTRTMKCSNIGIQARANTTSTSILSPYHARHATPAGISCRLRIVSWRFFIFICYLICFVYIHVCFSQVCDVSATSSARRSVPRTAVRFAPLVVATWPRPSMERIAFCFRMQHANAPRIK